MHPTKAHVCRLLGQAFALPGMHDSKASVHGIGEALQSLLAAASCFCPQDRTLPAWVSAGMQWRAGALPATMHLLARVSSPCDAVVLFRCDCRTCSTHLSGLM